METTPISHLPSSSHAHASLSFLAADVEDAIAPPRVR